MYTYTPWSLPFILSHHCFFLHFPCCRCPLPWWRNDVRAQVVAEGGDDQTRIYTKAGGWKISERKIRILLERMKIIVEVDVLNH